MYYLIIFVITFFGLTWLYNKLIDWLTKLDARTRIQEKNISLIEARLDLCTAKIARLESQHLNLNDKVDYLADGLEDFVNFVKELFLLKNTKLN